MTAEERDSACSVNDLFCGLHILPNMATAAFRILKRITTYQKKISLTTIMLLIILYMKLEKHLLRHRVVKHQVMD